MTYHRPSNTEAVRLQDIIRRLAMRGYTTKQMKMATGLSDSAIGKYRRQLGLPSARAMGAYSQNLPDPPRERWLDAEQPPVRFSAPGYRESTTVQLIRSWLTTLEGDNAVNRLAYDVSDALAKHDEKWRSEAREVVMRAQTYLYRLLAVIDDEQLRHAAMTDPMHRDDVPRALRLIHRSG